MSNVICHPYHMVDESPWPFYSSLGGLFLSSGMLSWFHLQDMNLFIIGLAVLSLVMYQWCRDITREGAAQGFHSAIVELGLRWGMLLFIVSEMFFLKIFLGIFS